MAEPLLSVSRLTHAIAGRTLYNEIGLGIESGQRLGLIGDNGTGKSTLLRLLQGHMTADAGQVSRRAGLRVSVLEQVPALPEGTIQEALSAPFAGLIAAIARYEGGGPQGGDPATLAPIEHGGGWNWQHRVERAASALGIDDLARPCAGLSGGYQKRVAMARMLLEEPELVLLDEPTNHLDTDTVTWLEKWLIGQSPAAVIVTHDRYFLDTVAQRMAELRDGQLRTYRGNYSDYLAARAMEEAQEARSDARTLRVLKGELDWARKSPQARTTKNRARLDRLAEGQEALAAKSSLAQIDSVRFGQGPRLGKSILGLTDITIAHPGCAPLFAPLNLELSRGERWGIIGPNGVGKTSLLRLLTGELTATSGRMDMGLNTQVAYFDQHRRDLDPDAQVRTVLVPEGGDTVFFQGAPLHVSQWLGRFAFPAAALSMRVSALSGGERNRLGLAKLMLTQANLLILDEPTNDLDLLTLGVLEEALLAYAGCMVVVSHDRYFLDKVVTHTLALTPRPGAPAQVELAAGGYTDLMQRRDAAARDLRAQDKKQAEGARGKSASASKRKAGLSYKEAQELAGMEAAIEAAEAQLATREAALADPALWQDADALAAQRAQSAHAAAAQQVTTLYARWEKLLALTAP